MKIDDWLLEILACPKCHSPLRADDAASELICTGADCGLAYPVRDDIPVLLIDEARDPAAGRSELRSISTGAASDSRGGGSEERAAVRDGAASQGAAGGQGAGSRVGAAGGPGDSDGHGVKRAVIAALSANLGIAVTKFAAFAITGSASMLAEAVHSVADSGNQVLLLIGRTRAEREETEEHPFGFGGERYFYAFIVAVVVFVVGAAFSIYEGIDRILHPEKLTSAVVAFAVLGVAIVLESFSLRTAVRESNRSRGRAGWRSFIRHAKAPELPAVLLEDFAALGGLLLALIGVALATITRNDRWDGAGSLAIGLLLGCVAAVLATEMKSLLIGESATADAEAAIVAAIEAGPEIARVIHLRTLHIGPETLLVAAKIAVEHDESAASVAAGIDAAERRIRAAVPIAELIFLEPDIYRAAQADPSDPAIKAARRHRGPLGQRPRPPS